MRLSDVNLTDPDAFIGGVPHEMFAVLRREAPVYRHAEADGPGFWCITKHADVRYCSKHPEVFSSQRQGTLLRDPLPEELPMLQSIMLNMDPPQASAVPVSSIGERGRHVRMPAFSRWPDGHRSEIAKLRARPVDLGHVAASRLYLFAVHADVVRLQRADVVATAVAQVGEYLGSTVDVLGRVQEVGTAAEAAPEDGPYLGGPDGSYRGQRLFAERALGVYQTGQQLRLQILAGGGLQNPACELVGRAAADAERLSHPVAEFVYLGLPGPVAVFRGGD
jgi:hypothetical protein